VRRRFYVAGLFAIACGSRTGLIVPPDATVETHDASVDVRDAGLDSLPPIDVTKIDVIMVSDCTDAAVDYIYVLSSTGDLLSFDPMALAFKTIGNVKCPTSLQPNSMAVDHIGTAYTDWMDFGDAGQIFKLSTANVACLGTGYVPQFGFTKFGMGFVADLEGGETLYIADTVHDPNGALATVDLKTFKLGYIAPFKPALPVCELTGTGDGRLFAFCMNNTGSTLAQVDPKTAKVIGANTLQTGDMMSAFAFGFWGGAFYLFTGPNGGSSTVTKFDPNTKKETVVATTPELIVGAGVSTCAPL